VDRDASDELTRWRVLAAKVSAETTCKLSDRFGGHRDGLGNNLLGYSELQVPAQLSYQCHGASAAPSRFSRARILTVPTALSPVLARFLAPVSRLPRNSEHAFPEPE